MTIGHGSIPLEFGFGPFKTTITLYGGPIVEAPSGILSVNLRKEQPGYGDLKLLIPDYGVPTSADTQAVVGKALRQAMKGNRFLYAGCLGGTGRTGLFLAVAALVAGRRDPIGFVRAKYKSSAVETQAQEKFILNVGTPWAEALQSSLNRAGFIRYFTKYLF